MKKSPIYILISSLLLVSLIGCSQNETQVQNQTQVNSENQRTISINVTNSPEEAVSEFLKDVQTQNYSSAKSNYMADLDNMAHFHNQIESISPTVANSIFDKLCDFTFTIENLSYDENDASKATVFLTVNYYDLGKPFITTLLDYIRNEISMTYDGKNDDDIVKKADEIIISDIDESKLTTISHIPVSISLDKDTWKVEKMSSNQELLNILSGNILDTINTLTLSLQNNNL